MLPVARGEQLVALEAVVVLATLSDLRWREVDGAGLLFVGVALDAARVGTPVD
jgi:hypothetical protein